VVCLEHSVFVVGADSHVQRFISVSEPWYVSCEVGTLVVRLIGALIVGVGRGV
jgi:hypothetical protein